ncbi:MAG: hypothetical protein ACRDJS_01130 [Actinomycetota bacterium]|jgi:hypothetical protein
MTLHRNERGIIADWLVKVVIGMVVFGVILFDVGAILVNFFTLDSAADDVAVAVSTDVGAGDVRQFTDHEIFQMVKVVVDSPDNGVKDARVLRRGTGIDDDGVITIRLRRIADTLIVDRIGAIEDWAKATTNGRAGTT